MGLCLGVEARTGQHIMYDPDQEGSRHARTLMRLADSQKFKNVSAATVSATPWSNHAAEQPKGVFDEKTVEPIEAKPDANAKVQGLYIKK